MAKVSASRIFGLVSALVVSALAGYYGGDSLRIAETPVQHISTAFSILAASLFAVISILGDPSMILPGNARIAWESAKQIQKDLQSFSLLFLLYMFCIALIIICEIIDFQENECFYWAFNLLAFASTLAFLFSFLVPVAFFRIQRKRLEDEIELRNKRSKP